MADQQSTPTQACSKIRVAIHRLVSERQTPILVALDGGSGAGKSTLAARLEREMDAVLVPMDDFFAADIPDAEWDTRSIEERGRDVFDWRRLRREALEPLLSGKSARWYPFDFEGGKRADGTYGMSAEPVEREPAPVVLLDGVDLSDKRWITDRPVLLLLPTERGALTLLFLTLLNLLLRSKRPIAPYRKKSYHLLLKGKNSAPASSKACTRRSPHNPASR